VAEVKEFHSSPVQQMIGKKIPAMQLKDLDGNSFDLLSGKLVLVNFWGSWCEPCRQEMPALDLLHRTFKNKGLTVIAIAEHEQPEISREYLRSHRFELRGAADEKQEVWNQFQKPGFPTSFLIDSNGVVIDLYSGSGLANLQAALLKANIW
jgi:thiol-disulfide isomerase/thioredoxin